MTTKVIGRSSIHFSQDILWPVTLLPSESGEEGVVSDEITALTVINLGDHFVALNNNALQTIHSNSDTSDITCNVYDGSICDFYIHANCGYRLMWEAESELYVIAFQPKNLAAFVAFRCGACQSGFSIKGSLDIPSVPSTLEEPARRGIVPNPKGLKVSPRDVAFESLTKVLQSEAKLYLSTAGNLYLPINNILREYLVSSAAEVMQPTALLTYQDYQLTDLSNSEEVDDIQWLTESYIEVVKEEVARDKQLEEHLERTYLGKDV